MTGNISVQWYKKGNLVCLEILDLVANLKNENEN